MAVLLVPFPIRRPVAAIYAIDNALRRQLARAAPGEVAELAARRGLLERALADVLSRWQRGIIRMEDAIEELEALERSSGANDARSVAWPSRV
jgi:hypothetical protein